MSMANSSGYLSPSAHVDAPPRAGRLIDVQLLCDNYRSYECVVRVRALCAGGASTSRHLDVATVAATVCTVTPPGT